MAQTSTLTTDKLKQYESRFDLGALFDFSNIVNASLDLKFILGHLLLTLMGKLLSLRGIVLIEKNDITYTVEAVKGISNVSTGQEITLKNLPKRLIYVADEDARRFPWLKYFREHGIHVIIPLVAREKILGVVGFGQSAVKMKFNQKEETYIKSLTNIAALAIDKGLVFAELNQLNRKLDRKIQELNTLFELGKEFNTVLDSDRLIKLLLFSIMGQIGVNRYFICLQTDELMNLVSSRLDSQLNPELWRLFPSVVKPTLVSSLNKKNELAYQRFLKEAGVEVLIPLQLQNQVRGILGLGGKLRGDDYSQTDLEFLTSLGNLAIISLENARLFKEAIEKQRMEDELTIAKEIQRGLLPAKLPQIPHFDISATNISSKQVGGDYYDVIPLGDEKYIIAVGDVSGKGTPASL
ncbi:MAG TPA: GAF domain-containing protein, partial [Bacteroidota bacterium]|nr:GAF domain-containing protein [Bacteroidota bacterium]